MRSRRIFALAALLAVRAAALDFSSFSDAVQDGDGFVWAIGSAQLSGQHISGGLFSTDGSAWRMVTCPGAPGYSNAQTLAKLDGGEVACLWSAHNPEGESKLLVSRHRGESGRLFATIELAPKTADKWSSSVRVLEDSRGQLWVFSGSRLWRVAPDGAAQVVGQFSEEQLTRPLEKDSTSASGIELLEDGNSRLWLFGTGNDKEVRTLRHPHVYDGQEWRTLSAIPGLPEGLIASVAVRDSEHLWCALLARGLYEIDLRTLEAKALPEPQPGAFRSIGKLSAVEDAMWAAMFDGEYSNEPPRALRQTTALWRFRAGQWRRLMNGFSDDYPVLDSLVKYENEALAPRGGGGFWKLPEESDSAALVDWRHGIRLAQCSRIFQMRGEKLLLMDFTGQGEGRFVQLAARTIGEQPIPTRLETFRLRVPMIQDAGGALWRIPLGPAGRLRHHNGSEWRDIDVPNQVSTERVARLASDSLGRIWLLPDDTTQTAALFDPQHQKWEVFKTLEVAYQVHRKHRAEFGLEADWLSPRYSEDGRIAFSHPRERLHYFDGKDWSSANNLLTAQAPFRAEIRPFFNRAGRLAWNYRSQFAMITQELHKRDGWQQAEFEDNPNDPSWKPEKKPPLPRGVVSDKPASYIQDRLGSTWLVAQHRLYRALPGVCVPVLGENEANPFVDGRSLDEAFITADGEIFLLTDQYERGEYLRLRFDAPLPDTQVHSTSTAMDAVRLDVESDAAEPRWFRWRLDGGKWSDPTADRRIDLESLPAGEHRCEVVALDRWLRADPTPAVVPLKVETTDAEQVARLIQQLGDQDFEKREAAVRLLARQPERSLAALRTARAAVPRAEAWWLDAAIEECERQQLPAGE